MAPSVTSCCVGPCNTVRCVVMSHSSWASSSACDTSCVESSTALFCSVASVRSSCMVSMRLATSRNAVGSSSTMMGVCCASARATITFCRSPSLSCAKCSAALCVMPTRSSASLTMRWSSLLSLPRKPVCGCRPSSTSSVTVSPPAAMRSVLTSPMRRDRSRRLIVARSLPSMVMRPASGCEKPVRARSKVDLPAPFCPSSATRRPRSRVSSSDESRTTVLPRSTYPTSSCEVRSISFFVSSI